MIKVTFCAHDAPESVGGPVTWIQRLLPALRDYGIESRCLFLTYDGDSGPALEALRKQGFDCPAVALPEYSEDRTRWILARLEESPPDVFVANLVVPAYFAARWVKSVGIPTVGILHSDDAFYRGLQREFVFGRQEFRLSALVCVSRALEQQVVTGQPAGVIVRRIAYGVPVPTDRVTRRPSGLRMVYVGRLAEQQKRISQVTRGLCRIVREVPGTDAVLYGDGPDKRCVEEILATDGAGLPVRLAGRVDSSHIQERLLNADVIVLLSDYEGLPIAILEAMACGCVPVCLRTRSGIAELIEDGVTGLLVDDRADGLVDALRRLQDEPGLWERLSRAARARVETSHANQACAQQWAELMRELYDDSGPRRRITIPGRVQLPPVHPALACEDSRAPVPPRLSLRIASKSRGLAGQVKRRLLGRVVH